MHFPLTTGAYLTQSGDIATIDEVCPVAAFGSVNDTPTIWTAWGENHNEAFRLVKRYRPVTCERRQPKGLNT